MSNKNTTVTKLLTLTDSGIEIVLAEGNDVDTLLAASMRAEPQYGPFASHRTNTTRKYQCNASIQYEACIKKLVAKHEMTKDGQAIRMIMEAGLAALGFASIVAEVQAESDEDAE